MSEISVLIVDDEPQIRRFLRASLGAHDFVVHEAATGKEAIKHCTVTQPDLVILDLGLPDVDGLDVLSEVRAWSDVPVIVLSIRSDESDKVDALDRGADDYVTKPFGMGELMARMRAALRKRQKGGEEDNAVFVTGGLSVDLLRRQVTVEGTPTKLSRKEFELLRMLVTHAGKVLTHQQLLHEVWGPAQASETQYLRVYIGQLRQKLERDPAHPEYIVTEAGVGYRLRGDDEIKASR
ncbi:MAG: DNA-binding response regulator [Rhodospirillaceae bacterium]|nr:DNA-binding response regulator [Rhodospirillaceae bacterium]